LSSESKAFGICLLRECDWRGTFGKGNKRNEETMEAKETVGRSLMGKHSLGRPRAKPMLYQLFDRFPGRGIWKHVAGICTKALIFLERHLLLDRTLAFSLFHSTNICNFVPSEENKKKILHCPFPLCVPFRYI